MIYYLVTRRHAYTMRFFIDVWAKELRPRVRVISYESLPYKKSLKSGTYIFSDIERLAPGRAEILAGIWAELSSSGDGVLLLNHPTLSMQRYELLRTLYERGINAYNVYRLSECRVPARFPVFIRGENDHCGPLTALLGTPADLSCAIEEIERRSGLDDKIMIEFCETSGPEGIFRKYSAYIVGEEIFPQHMMFGSHWMLKSVRDVARKKDELYEERRYLRDNPHEDLLRAVFRMAGINYGRVDYGILNGRPQIWEINTNPTLMHISAGPLRCGTERVQFVQKMISALESVDCGWDRKDGIAVTAGTSSRAACVNDPFVRVFSSVLDGYYYLRQSTVPRTRRGAASVARFINAGMRKSRERAVSR